MNESGPIQSGQEPPSDDTGAMTPAPGPPAIPGGVRPLFPIPVVILLVALAMLCHWRQVSYHAEHSPLDQLRRPVDMAVRMVERNLEFREATVGARGLEAVLYRLTWNTPESLLDLSFDTYEELLRRGLSHNVSTEDAELLLGHYTVLLGETGRTNDLVGALQSTEYKRLPENFVNALERVYLGQSPSAPLAPPGVILPNLRPGWAQDKLGARLALQWGQTAEAQSLEAAVRARGELWRRRTLLCLAAEGLCVLAGLGVLGWAILGRQVPWRASPDDSLAPWAVRDAIGVLAFADVTATVLNWMLWLSNSSFFQFIAEHSYLLLSLAPLVLLTHFCLLRRHGVTWWDLLAPPSRNAAPGGVVGVNPGLRLVAGTPDTARRGRFTLRVLLACALAVTAADIASSWAIGSAFHALGAPGHWSEGATEALWLGSAGARGATLQNSVLFGPGYEELYFRVLLYGVLRKVIGVMPAACFSSFLFAATHLHYSMAGILGVFVFGLACALAYERTRSLAVVIAGHALTNLLIVGTEWVLLG